MNLQTGSLKDDEEMAGFRVQQKEEGHAVPAGLMRRGLQARRESSGRDKLSRLFYCAC